ncbi:transferrin receptor ectodomain, apical domain-containing protein [Schizopora paradoxa]|uniref:RING-type E3 ubiquitin transferase n=1 Tax=Schizopora paradoxa TaxID=27342 RepID=A0A0H2RG85_9AGAM|nr:transferrin receptor ectodomain, apical domain-containing protein [Schizopora paradoxa]
MNGSASLLLLTLLVLDNGSRVLCHSPLTNFIRKFSSTSADGGWFWGGWIWGADSIVSVVDRSPTVSFASRPASFGPTFEDSVMGYGIPMNAFTIPCQDNSGRGNSSEDADRGGHYWLSENTSASMHYAPNLGCPRLCPYGEHIPDASESWIAIVQRGTCSFVAKVREAQRFGAKAVVVGGDNPDLTGNPNTLLTMYSQGDASDVTIPSTFIKFSDYARLTELIATSNTSTSGIRTVSLQISSEFASWEWYSPILTFIVLLLLPSSLTLVTLLIHRFRAARAARRERAPEDVVHNLPWMIWSGPVWEKLDHLSHDPNNTDESNMQTKFPADVVDLEYGDPPTEQVRQSLGALPDDGAGGDSPCLPSTSHGKDGVAAHPWFEAQTECAICLSDFDKGDHVRILPCKHIFHMEEVDEWLIHRKKLCPVCKADVTQPSSDDSPVPAEHSTTVNHAEEEARSPFVLPTEQTPLLPTRPLREDSQAGSDTSRS